MKNQKRLFHLTFVTQYLRSDMRKLSTVQNGGFPNIFSFHIIQYTLFSCLKNICNKKDFHVARQLVDENDPSKCVAKTKVAPVKFTKWFLLLFYSVISGSRLNATWSLESFKDYALVGCTN